MPALNDVSDVVKNGLTMGVRHACAVPPSPLRTVSQMEKNWVGYGISAVPPYHALNSVSNAVRKEVAMGVRHSFSSSPPSQLRMVSPI